MAMKITSVTWSATNLPSELSIDAGSGRITGTPTVQPGTYTAKVKVVTNYGQDEKDITIVVAVPQDWLPVIDPNQVFNVIPDTTIEAPGLQVKGKNVTKTV